MPLNPEYVKQLTAQLDLQLHLTLKYMDENPDIANIEKLYPETIFSFTPEQREALKNKITATVEAAVRRAKTEAVMILPITVDP